MRELLELDVALGMERDIEVLMKAIEIVDTGNKVAAKEVLEQVHGKVVEIEEYFWRPIDSVEVYERLKTIARELGDEVKAVTYDSKIRLFKANELEFKGRVQDFYGNKTLAVKYYEEALKLVPDHELAFPAHEKAHKNIEKAKGEIAKCEKKLESAPSDPELWFKKGLGLLSLGEVEKAIECLDRSLEFEPSNPDALARRGTAMESLGDHDGSKPYFEKALKIKPTSMIAKRGLNYADYFLEQK